MRHQSIGYSLRCSSRIQEHLVWREPVSMLCRATDIPHLRRYHIPCPLLDPWPPLCSGHELRTWRTYGAVMICICCFCLYIIVQTFVSPRGKNIRLMVLIIGYSYSTEWMKNPAPFRSGMLAVCSSISDSGGRGRKITGYESNTVVEASSVWL